MTHTDLSACTCWRATTLLFSGTPCVRSVCWKRIRSRLYNDDDDARIAVFCPSWLARWVRGVVWHSFCCLQHKWQQPSSLRRVLQRHIILGCFFSVDYPQQIYRIVMCTHYLQCYFARCYNAGRRLRGRRSFSVGSAVLSDLLQWPVGLQLWCRLFVLKAEVAAYCAKLSKCKTLVHESIFLVPTEMDFGLLLFGIWKYLICARHWTQPFHSVQMDRVKHLLTSCWCETEFICLTLISTRILYSINQSIKRRF